MLKIIRKPPFLLTLLQVISLLLLPLYISTALLLPLGTYATLAWIALRHPDFADHWPTSLIAFVPGLAFCAFVVYAHLFMHLGSTSALGFGFWWFVSLALQPLLWGIARHFHDTSVSTHA